MCLESCPWQIWYVCTSTEYVPCYISLNFVHLTLSLNSLPLQFDGQDVMVPWHLQPKYSGQSHSCSVPKSNKSDSAKAAARRAKKAEKLKKKLEKREKNKDSSYSCAKEEEVREGEKGDEAGGDCLLGELLDLCVDELDEQTSRDQQETASSTVRRLEPEPLSQDRECSAGFGRATDTRNKSDTRGVSKTETDNPSVLGNNDSKMPLETDTLAAQGYRTFQRYYHVFCRGELTELFSRVEGVRVLEEFYDHENWCVLAERLTPTQNM